MAQDDLRSAIFDFSNSVRTLERSIDDEMVYSSEGIKQVFKDMRSVQNKLEELKQKLVRGCDEKGITLPEGV